MDLDAYVARARAEWQRLEELTRRRRLSGAESRRAGRALPAGRHAPVGGAHVRARRRAGRATCPRVLARARNRVVGHPDGTWRGVGAFFARPVPGRALPAALVVARHAGGQRRGDRGDDALAARASRASSSRCCPPARGRPAGQPRLRELLQRVRRVALRRPGLDQQRLGRRAVPRARACSGCRSSTCCSRTSLNVAVIGSLMIRHGHGGALLRADPAARAARADRGLRRRGVGLRLFWTWVEPGPRCPGRSRSPGRAGPPVHGRARAGGGAARQRGDRGVRDAVRPAHLGADRDRRARRGRCFLAYVFVLGRRAVPPRSDRRHRRRPARGPGRHPGLSAVGRHVRRLRAGRGALRRGSGRPGAGGSVGVGVDHVDAERAEQLGGAAPASRQHLLGGGGVVDLVERCRGARASRSSSGSLTDARTTRWWPGQRPAAPAAAPPRRGGLQRR